MNYEEFKMLLFQYAKKLEIVLSENYVENSFLKMMFMIIN